MNQVVQQRLNMNTSQGMGNGDLNQKVLCEVYFTNTLSATKFDINLIWPVALPKKKIEFALVAPNEGNSFFALFKTNANGIELVYSEFYNPDMIRKVLNTRIVNINESSPDDQRSYQCELKHCLD